MESRKDWLETLKLHLGGLGWGFMKPGSQNIHKHSYDDPMNIANGLVTFLLISLRRRKEMRGFHCANLDVQPIQDKHSLNDQHIVD